MESTKKNSKKQIERYQAWIHERDSEKFFKKVNQFYVSLHQEVKHKGIELNGLENFISKIRKIRTELGEYAEKEQQMRENGLLITCVTLCGKEKVYMVIDIGASVVSITPEIVEILGITDQLGEKIELSLPAGIRVKAPQLLIPSISVDGIEAEYIKAVVLEDSMTGVDGCLGMSFLNRFKYSIEKGRGQELLLESLSNHIKKRIWLENKNNQLFANTIN